MRMAMASLQELRLIDIPWIDVLFPKIFRYLTTKDCFRLREASTEFEPLIDHYFENMKCIHQTDVNYLTSSELLFLASKTRHLQRLNLRHCLLTNEGAQKFFENNQSSLTHVNLSYTKLTDVTLHKLIFCDDIKQLLLEGCTWLTSDCMVTLCINLKKLTHLNLYLCPQIDFLTLRKWLHHPVHLFAHKHSNGIYKDSDGWYCDTPP